jgi:ketosteroid isomerase-like protein
MDPDVERLVRSAYDVFVAGDLNGLREIFHPDAEYVNPPEAVEGGTRRGEAELMEMWVNLLDVFDIDSVEIFELREAPPGAFAFVRFSGRGRGSGIPVDVQQYHVITVREGRVARLAWFLGREDALAAAGLDGA